MMTWLTLSGALGLGVVGFRHKPLLWIPLTLLSLFLFVATPPAMFLLYGAALISLILGLPLFVLMGLIVVALFTSVATGYETHESMTFLIRKVQEVGNKEILLAIPFFIVAGEIMTEGSLARQLINVARALFGWMPGGLAISAVSGCVFFAAISGSSPVTLIAIGSIMAPALVQANYSEKFSIGLLTTAGSLGILIPPSIPMIIYALMVGSVSPIDPADLFLAGIVPGLMIGAMLALYAMFIGVRGRFRTEPFSLKRVFVEARTGIWALLLPVIILGGIYSGVFTPTEGAVVSVVYALIVEVLIQRQIKPAQLVAVAERSMIMMGSLFLIMALALGLNQFFVLEQIPDAIVEWLKSMQLSQTEFLICVNLFLLVVGALMDIISAIMILAPMLAPMAVAMGIDPIHMGIIFIVNLEIGYLTPPVGLNLFVASTLFKKSIGEVITATLPTLGIMLIGLVIVTWAPSLSTGLVHFLRDDMSTNASGDHANEKGKVKTFEELMREMNQNQNP